MFRRIQTTFQLQPERRRVRADHHTDEAPSSTVFAPAMQQGNGKHGVHVKMRRAFIPLPLCGSRVKGPPNTRRDRDACQSCDRDDSAMTHATASTWSVL